MFLEINDLVLERNNKALFNHFSLKVEEGDFTGFYLPTGSGKTTLLDLLNFGKENLTDITNLTGDITFYREPVFARVFQNPVLLENQTVLKNLTIVLSNFMDKTSAQKQAEYFLEKTFLKDKAKVKAAKLSGGERQRLCIARALCVPANFLLMDEPFSNQYENHKQLLIEFIKQIVTQKKLTVLMVSHNKADLNALCQNVVNNFIINYN